MMRRNELSHHGKTWRKLKCILSSEGSLFEEVPYHVIPFQLYDTPEKAQLVGQWSPGLGEGMNRGSTEDF